MDLAYIKKLIKLVEKSEVDEIEIEEEGKKVRVAKNRPQSQPMMAFQLPAQQAPLPIHSHTHTTSHATPIAESSRSLAPAEEKKNFHEIRSPIVGTFYRAPSPDSDPYIEVGKKVKSGEVLCIIEAMKLMNEIESDIEGTIVQIMVENAKPVEYNQVLFLVDKS